MTIRVPPDERRGAAATASGNRETERFRPLPGQLESPLMADQTERARAELGAAELRDAYPGWSVHVVRIRSGYRIEAASPRGTVLIGGRDELSAALAQAEAS